MAITCMQLLKVREMIYLAMTTMVTAVKEMTQNQRKIVIQNQRKMMVIKVQIQNQRKMTMQMIIPKIVIMILQ